MRAPARAVLPIIAAITWTLGGCGLSVFPHPDAGAGSDPSPGPGSPSTGGGHGGTGGSAGGASGNAGGNRGGGPGGGSGGSGGGASGARPRDAGSASDSAGARPADASTPDPTPPPPGSGVVIGGMPLSRDQVVVFLHIGHSNMAGRTSVPAELRPQNFETDPRLWAYAKGGAWRPAKEPLSGDHLTRGGAGPGMSILRTAAALAPDRYLVSIGRGHDGSIGGYCRNFRKGALLYDFVMAPAMELRGKVTFGGIFVMLGVNEFRRDAANLTRFHECLEGIAADMRGDLGEPDVPFLIGDWEAGATGAFAPTHDYALTTKEQLRIAVQNIPRSGLIPSDMLPMSDDHHYDLRGYQLWAERGFEIMKRGGWLPWTQTD